MNNNIKQNMIWIKDYFNLRKNKQASNVAFQHCKHLHIDDSNTTFWQFLNKIDSNYIVDYEPSITTLKMVDKKLNLNILN